MGSGRTDEQAIGGYGKSDDNYGSTGRTGAVCHIFGIRLRTHKEQRANIEFRATTALEVTMIRLIRPARAAGSELMTPMETVAR